MHGARTTPHKTGSQTGPHSVSRRSPSHTSPHTRSRSWIVTAFNRLVLGRRYESLSVGEVSRRAGVGRSTFYEHFDDKDDLLRQAITPILRPLADAAIGATTPEHVRWVLDHFKENRTRTLAMLNSPTRFQIERALADLIKERLTQRDQASHPQPEPDAHHLEAARLAGAQIALVSAWLSECSTTDVAAMLIHAAR